MRREALFWWLWLVVVSGGIVAAGLAMLLFPGLTRRLFSLLLFASSETIDGFGALPARYIGLAHGVLGAVMVGWGAALLLLLFGPFRRGSREAWLTVAVSLAAWFVTDTGVSLATGFWQNAVLNVVVAVLFAVPLAGTWRACDRRVEAPGPMTPLAEFGPGIWVGEGPVVPFYELSLSDAHGGHAAGGWRLVRLVADRVDG